MKLSDAASYFDRTPAYDTATGKVLFLGQVAPFDDSRRDANAAYRRILSVRPGTAMPTSRAIRMMGVVWLIGDMEPDGLEELHREKYILQRAPAQVKVSRLSGFLAGTIASTVWASPQWIKDAKQLEVSSATPQIFDVSLPVGSDVQVRDILWDAAAAYLVLAPHVQASGILSANCVKLDQILPAVASLASRTYSPTLGTYSTSAGANVNALRVRWQSLFEYGSQAAERYQEGDIAVVLPTGTSTTTNTLITLAGVTYQTLAVLDLAGAVVLHSRVV